jgi:phosphatidylglycerophosphate synthase
VAFVPLAGRPTAAIAVLTLAAVSDMLDGWLARRQPQRISWGEWLDPVCDKFFIIAVMAGLYLSQHPPLDTLLPILTREIAVLVLFLVHRLAPSLRSIPYDYRAHVLGKATTAAQFLAAAALLLAHPAARYLAALCAVLGLLCAGVYARRGRTVARRPGASG